jgi:vacuolar protein sorting-associated protein 13A/C
MVDSIIVPILTSVLGDYFINFNDSNFKSSFFSGEIQLTNLIFNKKILETISVPLRLKFGIIGNITITLPSFLSLTTKGIKVKVSNIFLCLEMLEVTKWSEELVKKKY